MEGLEEKLGAVLNNPQMMQQLMLMAQSLGNGNVQPGQAPPVQSQEEPGPGIPDLGIDFATVRKISAMAQGSSIDPQQRNLLAALTPYLHSDRISRLEKAMRAAKLARMAGSLFSDGIPFLGR